MVYLPWFFMVNVCKYTNTWILFPHFPHLCRSTFVALSSFIVFAPPGNDGFHQRREILTNRWIKGIAVASPPKGTKLEFSYPKMEVAVAVCDLVRAACSKNIQLLSELYRYSLGCLLLDLFVIKCWHHINMYFQLCGLSWPTGSVDGRSFGPKKT